jgi:hypothetical protein
VPPGLELVAVGSVSGAASALPVAVAADKVAVALKAVVEGDTAAADKEADKAVADKAVEFLLHQSRTSGSEALIALLFTFYVSY